MYEDHNGWTKCHTLVIICICHLIKMDTATVPSEFSWQELILKTLIPKTLSKSLFASNCNSRNAEKHSGRVCAQSHLRGPKKQSSLTPPFSTLHIHFVRKCPGLQQIPRPSQHLHCQVRPLDICSRPLLNESPCFCP